MEDIFESGFDLLTPIPVAGYALMETQRISRWQKFILDVKRIYRYSDDVEFKTNYIQFKKGDRLKLPYEGYKFLCFKAKISGTTGIMVQGYIQEVASLARLHLNHQIREWSEEKGKGSYYDWAEIRDSLASYEPSEEELQDQQLNDQSNKLPPEIMMHIPASDATVASSKRPLFGYAVGYYQPEPRSSTATAQHNEIDPRKNAFSQVLGHQPEESEGGVAAAHYDGTSPRKSVFAQAFEHQPEESKGGVGAAYHNETAPKKSFFGQALAHLPEESHSSIIAAYHNRTAPRKSIFEQALGHLPEESEGSIIAALANVASPKNSIFGNIDPQPRPSPWQVGKQQESREARYKLRGKMQIVELTRTNGTATDVFEDEETLNGPVCRVDPYPDEEKPLIRIVRSISPLCSVQKLRNRERRLTAHQLIKKGTCFLQEKPLFQTPSMPPKPTQILFERALTAKVRVLPLYQQHQFLSMQSTFPRSDSHHNYPFSALFDGNALPCGPSPNPLGVFPTICLLNHSNSPNASATWDPQTHHQTVTALHDIYPGQELTLNYTHITAQTTQTAHLIRYLDDDVFTNHRTLYSYPLPSLSVADPCRLRIQRLEAAFGSPTCIATAPEACLAACRALLRVFTSEFAGDSAAAQIAHVYVEAFRICVWHGDRARARVLGLKAVEWMGKSRGGENGRDRVQMREWAEMPGSHPDFARGSMRWLTERGEEVDGEGQYSWLWFQWQVETGDAKRWVEELRPGGWTVQFARVGGEESMFGYSVLLMKEVDINAEEKVEEDDESMHLLNSLYR